MKTNDRKGYDNKSWINPKFTFNRKYNSQMLTLNEKKEQTFRDDLKLTPQIRNMLNFSNNYQKNSTDRKGSKIQKEKIKQRRKQW